MTTVARLRRASLHDGRELAYAFLEASPKVKRKCLNPPLVVFLHHGTGSMQNWNAVPESDPFWMFPRLQYDRLGFGRSSPPVETWGPEYHKEGVDELFELLDVVDREIISVERCILCGHSDGATIALLAAARDVDNKIAGVIAEAPHVFHGSRYGATNTYGSDGGFQYFKKHVMEHRHEHLLKSLDRDHPGMGYQVLMRWYSWWTDPANAQWDVSDSLQDVECPVLTIHGEHDIFFPESHTRFIAEGLSRGTHRLLRNAGHEIHKDQPDAFSAVAKAWLTDQLVL